MEVNNSASCFKLVAAFLKVIRTVLLGKLTIDVVTPLFNLVKFSKIQIQELQ